MKPERIGKYEIVGKLGQGAMGEVFRAQDPVLNRQVAIKRISAGLDADESVRKRFRREAQSVAKLSHPNIITVYELGEEGDQLFMAMELLDGVDLKAALAQRRLSLDDKVDVIDQMLQGLAFAHTNGIVHRDLKPANVHLLPAPKDRVKVKIMDFGLAKVSGSDMTSTGTVMGTPHYMSPEQVRGHKADARSDIFAVGCVFYELLTGRKPFDAESMHAVLFKVIQEDPPPIAELAPDVPAALAQVVERALAKDPAERYADAAEMLEAVRQARQAVAAGFGDERGPGPERPSVLRPGIPPTTRPPGRSGGSHSTRSRSASRGAAPARRSHAGLYAALVLGSLVALVGAAWAVRSFVLAPAPQPSPSSQVQTLAQAVIDTQVEVARRRLDAGEFDDAAKQAERALKLDSQSIGARRVLEQARAAQQATDKAVASLRAASPGGPAAADAAFELMRAWPASPEAEKAALAAGAAFRAQAERAQKLARDARRAAEQARADRSAGFGEGAERQRQAEQALQAGNAASAARQFLEAQRSFERARTRD
jgi:serine/threonine protein kinase